MKRVAVVIGAWLLAGCVSDPVAPQDGGADANANGTDAGDAGAPKDGGGADAAPCMGACDHVVFVSSVKYTGNLGGPSGANSADAKCNDLAKGKLAGTFVAWVSGGADTAKWRLWAGGAPALGRWVLPDKATVVADSWAGLTSGTLKHAIDQDESGTTVPALNQRVITNTNAQGDADSASYDCGNFFLENSSFICPGHISSGMDWTTSAPCNFLCSTQDYRIYCMQK